MRFLRGLGGLQGKVTNEDGEFREVAWDLRTSSYCQKPNSHYFSPKGRSPSLTSQSVRVLASPVLLAPCSLFFWGGGVNLTQATLFEFLPCFTSVMGYD